MKSFVAFFALTILSLQIVQAQEVEHNYLVGPGKTTCDSLMTDDLTIEGIIKVIRTTQFRFNQEFKLTRKQGLQKGEYYSCDNKSGFLIVKYDNEYFLFTEVQKNIWNELISSADPEQFFLETKDRWDNQK